MNPSQSIILWQNCESDICVGVLSSHAVSFYFSPMLHKKGQSSKAVLPQNGKAVMNLMFNTPPCYGGLGYKAITTHL